MLKTYQKLHSRITFHLIRNISNYSTQPATKESTEYEHQLKEFQRISNIQHKIRAKKSQKLPFVKNLLLGVFDTDLLTYPELNNEDLNNLNAALEQAQPFLRKPEIRESTEISPHFLKQMAAGRLLGLQTSQLMGGRELTATEMCRFTEAFTEINNLKDALINNEVLGIQTLLKFGSDHLKRKYLQKLIDGENLSAFCVLEPLESNVDVFQKTGQRSGDGKSWVLNGHKKLVVNGSNAEFYVVVAATNYIIKDSIRQQKFTAFLVERDFGGITSHRHNTVDGKLNLTDVVFENTLVPSENIIGSQDAGEEILSTVYPEYRLSTGPVCSVLVKNLINKVTQYYIDLSKEPNLLYETDAIRMKLGELSASLYAIDSMTYLTSGLIDNYEAQDVELETAIVKVFASEQAFLGTSSCLDLIGAEASLEDHWCSQLHKEALCQATLNDTNDNLKILIALFGIRYAGQKINDLVKKIRNPLFYSTFILKRMWNRSRHENDNPKLNLYLHHHLHPSCLPAAERLEYSVLRLQYATEILLSRHGAEVVNKHADLRRLAESIIDIYAMTACISRASRSYCIGLQHAEYEMTLAASFTFGAVERIKSRLSKVIEGPLLTNDENYRFISERLFNFKQYYPVHPLTRNF